MKFQVGDKVRLTEKARKSQSHWIAFNGIYTVSKVSNTDARRRFEITVKEIKNPLTARGWFLDERFELVRHKEPYSLVSVSLSGEDNLKRVKANFPMLEV